MASATPNASPRPSMLSRKANPGGEIFVSHIVSRAIRGPRPRRQAAHGRRPDRCRHARGLAALCTRARHRRHRYRRCRVQEPFALFRAAVGRAGRADRREHRNAARLGGRRRADRVHDRASRGASRTRTESALRQHGLNPHALIMDCRHGRRFLVNGHAGTNPYPSAVAVNLERNSATLGAHLSDWR